MVELAKKNQALRGRVRSLLRLVFLGGGALIFGAIVFNTCAARVEPNEWGVQQVRLGSKTGVGDTRYEAGLYFLGPGTTMHTFPREMHILEASNERTESRAKARGQNVAKRVDDYFDFRDAI